MFAKTIKFKTKQILMIVLFGCIFSGSYGVSAQNVIIEDSNSYVNNSYKWIERDKIKAGYFSFLDPVSKIDLVRELGLNTVIVKCYRFEYPTFRQDTIYKMKEWAKAAKNNNIHLFFAVNWQPFSGIKKNGYKPVVYEDGVEGMAVCPLDERFWEKEHREIFKLIAKMSIQPDFQVDGIFLDMEIYGTEKEESIRRNYYEKRCGFSDACFSKYLLYKGYKPAEFPALVLKDRKDWLIKNNLLDDYFVFLRWQVQNKAEQLRDSVHRINPNLFIGMYPHPVRDNWVQYPLAKGFSTQRMPMIVFGIHSYGYNKDNNGDGYTKIPKNIKQRYLEDGINSVYSAGFLFRRYTAGQLERNLKKAIEGWDGYWLYFMRQLWEQDDMKTLIDSSDNLKKAIQKSNQEKSV